MSNQLKSGRSVGHHIGSDRGIAVVVLLYGMSVFSVFSLSLLRNAELEKTFRTADDPDLHVVLYAGGASSQTMIGRLNLPTASRKLEGPDKSTEVRIPGAPHLTMASELPAGWWYAVRLTPDVRVCCDGGDNACAGVTGTRISLQDPSPRPCRTLSSRPVRSGAAVCPLVPGGSLRGRSRSLRHGLIGISGACDATPSGIQCGGEHAEPGCRGDDLYAPERRCDFVNGHAGIQPGLSEQGCDTDLVRNHGPEIRRDPTSALSESTDQPKG